MQLPKSYQYLFPSSSTTELDVQRDKTYIIETLLKNASLEAWQWMTKTYSKNDITSVLKSATNLKKKDTEIWSIFYKVPKSELACLQPTFRSGLKSSWAY
ncbi:MAG: hypothetical protein GW947_00360 [Candidatus Pacebacteria bacterium]|nr:hypothetical protein [Candidatus Paceibacterota bacterium]PIR61200.1 MAG: hypothetical protein COU68_00675 [Candidatus Pacebacteria bacterium CG10_big_fil_rev_8_21_14_0_10_45_6]